MHSFEESSFDIKNLTQALLVMESAHLQNSLVKSLKTLKRG